MKRRRSTIWRLLITGVAVGVGARIWWDRRCPPHYTTLSGVEGPVRRRVHRHPMHFIEHLISPKEGQSASLEVLAFWGDV